MILSARNIFAEAVITISSQSNSIVVAGTGALSVFSFPFVADSAADIFVSYIDNNGNVTSLSSSQYSLTINVPAINQLWGVGGTVTYPLSGAPISIGSLLLIQRILPLTQSVSVQNQGNFYPQVIEEALDVLEMQIQQTETTAGRAIQIPAADAPGLNVILPVAAQRANQLVGFDGSGNVIAAQPSNVLVSAAMQPVVEAATLPLAMTAFGNGIFVNRILPYLNPSGNAPGGFNSGWPATEGGGLPTGGHYFAYLDGNNYFNAEVMQIDSYDPTCIYQHSITNAVNNGSGAIRLTIIPAISGNETTGGFVSNSFAAVGQVGGTTEANGTWTITVINSTTVDLQGSTFAHAFTSGGSIFAGPLDLAPYFGATRCVPGRAPIFFDAVGGFLFAGQTTQHINTGPQTYGQIVAFVVDPNEAQTASQGLISIGVPNAVTGSRGNQSCIGFMQGIVGLGPGYQLPGQLAATQANIQAADLGYGTVNMGTGYYVDGAPIGRPMAGSHKNLIITNDAVTPNTKIDINADSVALFGGTASMTYGKTTCPTTTTVTGFPQVIDFTINGVNGLDTGALAPSTWYSLWVIFNPVTGATGALGSLSSTAPTLPSGYTFKGRVGWALTDGSSHFYRFIQNDNEFQYALTSGSNTTNLPVIASGVLGTALGTSVSWHASAWASAAPSTTAALNLVLAAGGGTTDVAIAAPNANYATFAHSPYPPLSLYIGSAGGAVMGKMLVESANVYYACSLASGSLAVLGYTDNI